MRPILCRVTVGIDNKYKYLVGNGFSSDDVSNSSLDDIVMGSVDEGVAADVHEYVEDS